MNYSITLKDFLVVYLRGFFYQNLINDKYYHNFGFLYILYPIIKKIKKSPELIKEFIVHNFEYFNTNPYLVSFLLGVSIRLLKENSDDKIRKFKFDMMGPLAALGDEISWGILRSFLVLVSAIFVFFKYYYGILIFFIFYNLILHIFFRFIGLIIGYRNGLNVIFKIAQLDLQNKISILKKVGLIMWGSAVFLLLQNNYNFIDLSFHTINLTKFIYISVLIILAVFFNKINNLFIPLISYLIFILIILFLGIYV